jgi:hypothetical protein
MDYKFDLSDMRSSVKEGKRYARVRAIANGTDSFNSIFTRSARESLIEQLKSNSVKTNALHKTAIDRNMKTFLENESVTASGERLATVQTLLGNLTNRDFPIGKVVEASFVDDNTIEALIEENTHLAKLGPEYKDYLDGAWDMVSDGFLSGVSVVFNNVESFVQNGKTFIEKLNLLGLDFVDRPSHTETRVLDTFMRAAQDSYAVEEPKIEKVDKMTEEVKPQVIDVDEIVAKAEAKMEAKATHEAELKAKEDTLKQEYEDKIKALEAEKATISKEAEDALEIAKEAVSRINTTVAKSDNPHVEAIAENAQSAQADPLANKTMAELFELKDKV